MALTINDYGNRIMVSGTPVATDVITTRTEWIQSIEWRDPVQATDTVVLLDGDGNEFWRATCLAAGEPIMPPWPKAILCKNGIKCSALVSGTLMIYFV